MGEIKKSLRAVALFGLTGAQMLDQLERAGEAIESELQNFYTRFNDLSDNRIKDYNDLRDRFDRLSETVGKKLREQDGQVKLNLTNMATLNKHIKELAEQAKRIEDKFDSLLKEHRLRMAGSPLRSLEINEPVPTDKEEIATDKFNKPPGGLERGDVMKHQVGEGGNITVFLFKKHNKSTGMFGGYVLHSQSLKIGLFWDWQPKYCTFEFRPRFPDRKER